MALDLGGGLQGFGQAASGLIDASMKEDADIRAANRKLSDAERLMAAQEALKNRAAERFSAVARGKAGEQVPVEAAPVTNLGKESAQAIGLENGMQGNAPAMLQQYQAVLSNPNATAEQKQSAQEILDQIGKQAGAQKGINAEAVGGKMRNRTTMEAARAALDETLLNDPAAFAAGSGLINAATKPDLEERKLEQRERIEQARIEQRDRSDDKRQETLLARLEKTGASKAETTALIQNVNYLKDTLGYTPKQIDDFISNKKKISVDDVAAKFMANDKFGEMTAKEAAQKAVALVSELELLQNPESPKPSTTQSTNTRPPLSSFKK